MVKYGLLGRGISHSFSSEYFAKKFQKEDIDALYLNFDLADITSFSALIDSNEDLKGFNVTSPYKREVIPFLTVLTQEARAIGAVNTVRVETLENGKKELIGHNTDARGFAMTLSPLIRDMENESSQPVSAIVLGSGGASSAVCYALAQLGIQFKVVSRAPDELKNRQENLPYQNIVGYNQLATLLPESRLIINATPVGMFPYISDAPELPYGLLTNEHLCYDLIYNPSLTRFLSLASSQGAKIKNGLDMLYNQAELSWQFWTDK